VIFIPQLIKARFFNNATKKICNSPEPCCLLSNILLNWVIDLTTISIHQNSEIMKTQGSRKKNEDPRFQDSSKASFVKLILLWGTLLSTVAKVI